MKSAIYIRTAQSNNSLGRPTGRSEDLKLHWLPIRQRITFKTAVLVYKCQHGTTPPYLQAYCEPMSACSSRCLRYVNSSLFWLFHAPEQTTAIVVLPSMDLICGTVFLMNWDHLTSLITFRNKLKSLLF